MNALVAEAFADELEKISAVPLSLMGRVGRAVWNRGAGRVAVGAAPGAAVGYAAAPEDQRVQGAILGGAVGAAGGFASPLATRAGRKAFGEWGRRAVQSQKHQLLGKGNMPIKPGASAEEIAKVTAAQKAGLTSIPGLAKGMYRRPGGTLREAWRHAGKMGKVMAVGDVALGARAVADPTTEAGIGEKALGTVGTAGGYLLASRLGFVPSMLVGGGLGKLTGMAGRGVDVLTGERGRKLKRKTKKKTEEAIGLARRPSTQYLTEHALRAIPEQARQVVPGGVT
ncbi:MAG: hypothetical protein KAY24_20085 [Candidatus Eisenbacteria sp.]|nr:hypothetical protein [Candidatus Eisenbacteria bacterium]